MSKMSFILTLAWAYRQTVTGSTWSREWIRPGNQIRHHTKYLLNTSL